MPDPDLRPRALGGAAIWSIGNAAAAQVISLAAFLVTARLISPEAFGVVAVATLIVEMTKRVLIEPLATRLTATHEPSAKRYEVAFSAIVTISALASIALLLAAFPIAWIMGIPQLAPVLMLLSVMLLGIGLTATHEVWYTKRFNFRLLAIRRTVAVSIGGVTGVALALLNFGLWSLVAQQLVAAGVGLWLLYGFSDWRPRLRFAPRAAWARLREVRQLSYGNILTFVSSEADLFFVTSLVGATAGGLYSAAKRLILAANMIISYSLSGLLLAAYAKGSKSDRAHHNHLQSLTIMALVLVPLFVGLALLAQEVIDLLLDAKWAGSGEILASLALATLAQALFAVISNYLLAAGAERARTLVIAFSALLIVTVLPLIAFRFGAVEVAHGTAVISWVSLATLIAATARVTRTKLSGYVQALWLPLAGGAVMILAAPHIGVGWPGPIRLILCPFILLAVYMLVIGVAGFPMLRKLVRLV